MIARKILKVGGLDMEVTSECPRDQALRFNVMK